MAERVGVQEGTIRHWEEGRAIPPIPRLEKLADVFEISPFLLLIDAEDLPLIESAVLAVEQLPDNDLRIIESLLARLLGESQKEV